MTSSTSLFLRFILSLATASCAESAGDPIYATSTTSHSTAPTSGLGGFTEEPKPDLGSAACKKALETRSSVGCEFYAMSPDVVDLSDACYAAFVANTSAESVTLDVARGNATLDPSAFARIPKGTGLSITYEPLAEGKLPPGEVAILFLSKYPGSGTPCPPGIVPAVTTDETVHGNGYGDGFRITTSAPVVAYDIFPYGGADSAITGATLLLPTSAWDTNYIAIAPYETTQFTSWLQVIASEDDTEVTLAPTVALVGGDVIAPTPAGVLSKYTLNRGQYVQISQPSTLTGSPLQSNKPVGVVGGNQCMFIPEGSFPCDAAHQMLPPVRALGSEYAAVRYRNRIDGLDEAPPFRLVGIVDETELTYEPEAPDGAPLKLRAGQSAEFRSSSPFLVRSQDGEHPFYLSAHMTSCNDLGVTSAGGDGNTFSCSGDPESVNVVPTAQFQNAYVFFTDPTYPETNLVFIRKRAADGFKDVTLDCAGVIGGWAPVDSTGDYQYTRFDLVRHDFEAQGKCNSGRREAKSDGAFSITVWGWGTDESTLDTDSVSYAYPAGASVDLINDLTIVPK